MNTVSLCDRHCAKEWEDNFTNNSRKDKRRDASVNVCVHLNITTEPEHFTVVLRMLLFLVSMNMDDLNYFKAYSWKRKVEQADNFLSNKKYWRWKHTEHTLGYDHLFKLPRPWVPVIVENISVKCYCR
jgi:hypothetical protein